MLQKVPKFFKEDVLNLDFIDRGYDSFQGRGHLLIIKHRYFFGGDTDKIIVGAHSPNPHIRGYNAALLKKYGLFLPKYLKTLDTIGNCQRRVFTLGVYLHKITNL